MPSKITLNTEALIKALENDELAGAGLDAFEEEKKFCTEPAPLKTLPNVIVTPHAAAVSTQGVRDVMEYCASSIADFMQGKEVRSILNKDYINHIQ